MEGNNKNQGRKVVKYQSIDKKEVELSTETCRKYLVRGRAEYVTAQEFMFFMATCEAQRLNPFINDCYLIKFSPNEQAAIVVSANFHKKIARSQPDCVGWKNGIIVRNEAGSIEYREGSFLTEAEVLLGGWADAKPSGWAEPCKHSVALEGYIRRKKDGSPTVFWQKEKQPLMIAKVALVQLLRMLWPASLMNMYTIEELPEAPRVPAGQVEMPKDSENGDDTELCEAATLELIEKAEEAQRLDDEPQVDTEEK